MGRGWEAGYQWSARKQMQVLDKDLKEGRIDEAEYEIRKDQVERGSLLY